MCSDREAGIPAGPAGSAGMIEAIRCLCNLQGRGAPNNRPPKEQVRQVECLRTVKNELRKRATRLADALQRFNDVGVDDPTDHRHECVPYIPWVRIFSREKAPLPTSGYFVDLLFGWDRRLYVAILPGVKCAGDELDIWRDTARAKLMEHDPQVLDCYLTDICLHAPPASLMAPLYEQGLVVAEEIDLRETTTEDELLDRICAQLELLAIIYGN